MLLQKSYQKTFLYLNGVNISIMTLIGIQRLIKNKTSKNNS